MKRVFKRKNYLKVVVKPSPRAGGYIASYFMLGEYVCCKHIAYNEVEKYCERLLEEYEEVTE